MAHPRFLLSLQRRPAPQSSGLSGRREPRPWHSVQSPPVDPEMVTGTGTVRGGRTREPQQQLLQGPEAILSPGRGAFQTGLRSDGPGRRALRAVAVVAAWGQAFPCAPDRVGASVVTGAQRPPAGRRRHGRAEGRVLCPRLISPSRSRCTAVPTPWLHRRERGVEKGGPTDRSREPAGRAERDGPTAPPAPAQENRGAGPAGRLRGGRQLPDARRRRSQVSPPVPRPLPGTLMLGRRPRWRHDSGGVRSHRKEPRGRVVPLGHANVQAGPPPPPACPFWARRRPRLGPKEAASRPDPFRPKARPPLREAQSLLSPSS